MLPIKFNTIIFFINSFYIICHYIEYEVSARLSSAVDRCYPERGKSTFYQIFPYTKISAI